MPLPQERIVHPAAWRASELLADPSWRSSWTAAELAEMDAIVAAYRAAGGSWNEARDLRVEAPLIAARLDRLAHELETGRGLAVLEGVPVDAYAEDEARALCLWMGWQLGVPRGQNADGALLSAVRDVGADYRSDPEARGYMSSSELFFHTDGCDITGLLCLHKAAEGGESRISSSLAIYNALLQDEPELLPVLERGFPFYIRDADGKGGRLLPVPLPVYFEEAGALSAAYNSKSVESAVQKRGAPLEPLERRALERVQALAEDPEFCAEFMLEPGAMILFSNWTTFHARRAFTDAGDPARRRCLLRLWIHSKAERPLPSWMAASARSGLGADRAKPTG